VRRFIVLVVAKKLPTCGGSSLRQIKQVRTISDRDW
jgi:hypothetical protein